MRDTVTIANISGYGFVKSTVNLQRMLPELAKHWVLSLIAPRQVDGGRVKESTARQIHNEQRMKKSEAKLERELWQTVEILFDHFASKTTWTRIELARALGDVHPNTIYRDESLALEWLQSYEDSLKNPRGEVARKQRLTHYNIWILVIIRCITKRYGQTKAATFLFNNEEKLTHQAFNEFKENRNARTTQARRISAA